jgi:hypothetical protein
MSILMFIVILAVIGLCLHLVITYIPMPAPFRTIIIAVVVIVCLIWLLQLIGLTGPMIPRIR